jgi:hypothetical protein
MRWGKFSFRAVWLDQIAIFLALPLGLVTALWVREDRIGRLEPTEISFCSRSVEGDSYCLSNYSLLMRTLSF